MTEYCLRCNSRVYTYENNIELNPYIGRYSSNKCRKYIFIRHNTFYYFFLKNSYINYKKYYRTILKRGKIWSWNLFYQKNKIYPISQKHVNHILEHMRLVLAYYIKDCYAFEHIAEENHNASISIEEYLLTHENNSQVWVVGMINNITRKIRLEIVEDRSRATMEKIINIHIAKGNNIISDIATC